MKTKGLIFLMGLMFFSFSVNAQEVKSETRDKPKTRDVYCQIIVQQKFMSSKMKMFVDYGEDVDSWIGNYGKVRDEQSGKVMSFHSQVDALNYMTEEGWFYVNSFIVAAPTGMGGVTLQFYYLLKREIPFEGL